MSLIPSSTVFLCNVPFDNSYKNQIYFSTLAEQQRYFETKVVDVFHNYYPVRKALPDGATRTSIKVEKNIGELRSIGVNYMYYTNSNHSSKTFYAFVTEVVYINEETTELVFETDVYQTWLKEVTLLPSFVEREHSATDLIGDNRIPEKFNIEDYNYYEITTENVLENWGYLVASAAPHDNDAEGINRGTERSGIYQGLYFYYVESPNALNSLLDKIEENKGDSVHSITLIPKFCVGLEMPEGSEAAYIGQTKSAATQTVYLNVGTKSYEGFIPKNNKLFTSPFYKIMVTNNNGVQAEYVLEDFDYETSIQFRMYGDISISPSVTLVPKNYRGANELPDFGITLSGFPQCSFNSDSFKLWAAKNEMSLKTSMATDVAKLLGAVALLATPIGGTGLALSGAAAGSVAGGIGAAAASGVGMNAGAGILSTIGSIYSASKEPNKMHAGNASTNLLTAMKKNRFSFYVQHIKPCHAKTIDDYFTMFGYQTNRLKVPNVSERPCFNYVKTQGVNIKGKIPNNDMAKLKAMYDTGVTFWKPTAEYGDYSVDNSATVG